MGTLTASAFLPSKMGISSLALQQSSIFEYTMRKKQKKNQFFVPVAGLFGPAIFEASKLQVFFLGVDEKKHPGKLPRTYTLTHSDITSKLTLAISHQINHSQLQGWYNRFQRDEVVAEWKKVKEKMYLHVHCHISGGHFLLDLCARLRYCIFCKELPLALKAFVHGDLNLLTNYPELQEALVLVHFHSNIPEYDKIECWGSLKIAASPSNRSHKDKIENLGTIPQPCKDSCNCCFPAMSSIPWSQSFSYATETRIDGAKTEGQGQSLQQI